jgi:hypothetical protein
LEDSRPSSAYSIAATSSFITPPPSEDAMWSSITPTFHDLIIASHTKLKIVGDGISPCVTPLPAETKSYGTLPIMPLQAVNPINSSVKGVFASLLHVLLISLVFTLDAAFHMPFSGQFIPGKASDSEHRIAAFSDWLRCFQY